MSATSKTAKAAARRGFYRTTIEIPLKTWGELQTALKRRAALMKAQHGVEANDSFTAWLRTQAEQTIAAFK